jgi:hypothetical protein
MEHHMEEDYADSLSDEIASDNSSGSNPHSNPSTSTKKPACDYCKRRKIKCDCKLPCFQCQKRGIVCEYNSPAVKPKGGLVGKLQKRVDHLEAELEVQKQLVEYWRKLYEEKDRSKSPNDSPPVVFNRRPSFSKTTSDFCANVLSAVAAVTNSFLHVMKAIMPSTTLEYTLEYSALIWNRLIDSVPEDFVTGLQSSNIDSISLMMLHSSVFALGAKLRRENELATHFQQITDGLLKHSKIEQCRNQSDTAKRLILALVYRMFLHKADSNFDAILPLWQRTADLLIGIEKFLDKQTSEEIAFWMVLLEPSESGKTDLWLRKLETGTNNGKIETLLLKDVSRVVVSLPRLTQLVTAEDSNTLRLMWDNVLHLESLLNQLRDSPLYRFYGILVYGIKALSAINMPHNMNVEISQCTHIVAQLYTQITDPAEQIWLSRDFEYLHYVFTKLQHQAPDYNTFEEVLDNLIALTTVKTYQNDSLAFYGNPYDQSQSTMTVNSNILVQPQHCRLSATGYITRSGTAK